MKLSFKKEEKIILSILGTLALLSFFIDGYVTSFMYAIRNYFLDYSLSIFSLTFSLFIPLLAATSVYLYLKKRKEGILPLWASFLATTIIVYAIKFLVGRPRQLGEMFTWLFHLPDYSFPSAHAALAFCILGVIDEEFRKLKIFWLALAIVIVFSRLYFQYHYFSDIAFGALIGYGIGMIVVRLFKKQKK